MGDEMIEMVPNDPDYVVYAAFSERWFQEIVRIFQRDNEMRNIVMADREAREQATLHWFKRAKSQAEKR